MKRLLTFLLLFSLCLAKAQQPAILSMEGIGGNVYEIIMNRIVTTDDGGFITHYYTNSSPGTGNVNAQCNTTAQSSRVFRKYQANGEVVEWERCYPVAYFLLRPTPDGNFIVGGYGQTTSNSSDFYLAKLDSQNNVVWIHYYGGSHDEILRDMIPTEDDGYIMFGLSYSDDGDVGLHYGSAFAADYWAIKLDSSGNKVWSTVVGGTDDEGPRSVALGPGGGCYLYGWTASSDYDCTAQHGNGDALVARLDSSGAIVWTACYGGSDIDGGYGAITGNGNGGVLVANGSYSSDGQVQGQHGGSDFWILNIDSNSNILWDHCYGGTSNDIPNAICKSADGDIWIGGGSSSGNYDVGVSYGYGDAWILGLDSTGNMLKSRVLGTSARDEILALHPMADGTVFAGGTYRASGATGDGLPLASFGAIDVFLTRFAPWTTSIETADNRENPLTIYPNPAEDRVYIKTDGKPLQIKVLDLLGNKVYESNHPGGEGIDVSNWARGVYYLYTRSDKGPAMCTKLLLL